MKSCKSDRTTDDESLKTRNGGIMVEKLEILVVDLWRLNLRKY